VVTGLAVLEEKRVALAAGKSELAELPDCVSAADKLVDGQTVRDEALAATTLADVRAGRDEALAATNSGGDFDHAK
jgi:hypothetical protein